MMAAVFALMSLALVIGWFGRRDIAIACAVVGLILAVKLFLWEIYSPDYGFRMPWIQTSLDLSRNG
jgi:hypothetical protein